MFEVSGLGFRAFARTLKARSVFARILRTRPCKRTGLSQIELESKLLEGS